MDLVTGALGMLPSKLLELLKEEYKLQKGIRVKVESLSRELECMHAALRKVAAVPWDQLDEQVKIWAREVREASYDIEDLLDTFLVRVDGHEEADLSGLKRAMKKMGGLFRKGKARRGISCAIEGIKKQLQEVAERRARYKVDDLVAEPAATTSIDPRLSALYIKVSQLVGIEEPREDLIEMLTSIGEDDMETKIVSIVGFGGLGKTTLAKAVYENLSQDFHFKAFVPVGRNPDLNTVLKDILIDLDKKRYSTEFNLTILNEKQLIDELREFLKDKRYFIVIDDIWDVPSWNIISCALDNNSLGSKIVITTRKHDVAEEVGCSYNMEPLLHESSKVLFYGRIFGSEDMCPKPYVEVSEKIIKKCGGVPLAIITASGLLANKLGNIKDWYEYCDSIGSGLGSNPDMENMRKILSLSYYDLPAHLKTCLIYLSIFPEDFEIWKQRLIWRWIAEDFVQHGEGGQSLFQIGESYFNELINRSLIQPAVVNEEGMPRACRVHDMVLDLICSLSREENFLTTISGHNKQNTYSLGSKVHRLSLHKTTTWPTVGMSKLRSLTIFNGDIVNSMPAPLCHLLLRVLDLEGCNLKGLPSLSFVGNLFHLRYLGLRGTRYAGEVPLQIGKLQFLQTLDLFQTDIKEFPSSIVGLRQLMCLCFNWTTCLPNGLRNLTSLEMLLCAVVDSAHLAEGLGHLTLLRRLTVQLEMDKEAGCDEGICKALLQSIRKLQKLQDLVILSDVVMNLEGSLESNMSSLGIRETGLLPTWVNPGSLLLLSSLDITVAQVRSEDIQVLGMLESLHVLEVTVSGDNIQVLERFMVAPDAFPYARVCKFNGFLTVPCMFPQGAMPVLENFSFCIRSEDFSEGDFTIDDLALDHLPSLQSVYVELYCEEDNIEGEYFAEGEFTTYGEVGLVYNYLPSLRSVYARPSHEKKIVMDVKEKLRQEADVHPNYPFIDARSLYFDPVMVVGGAVLLPKS